MRSAGPRWRHNGNIATNVAFADGSVRSASTEQEAHILKQGTNSEAYDNEFPSPHDHGSAGPNDKQGPRDGADWLIVKTRSAHGSGARREPGGSCVLANFFDTRAVRAAR
jgi:prepilin-type processing-associated H-X9-DG protein